MKKLLNNRTLFLTLVFCLILTYQACPGRADLGKKDDKESKKAKKITDSLDNVLHEHKILLDEVEVLVEEVLIGKKIIEDHIEKNYKLRNYVELLLMELDSYRGKLTKANFENEELINKMHTTDKLQKRVEAYRSESQDLKAKIAMLESLLKQKNAKNKVNSGK